MIIAQKSDLNQDLEPKILNMILQSFEIISFLCKIVVSHSFYPAKHNRNNNKKQEEEERRRK